VENGELNQSLPNAYRAIKSWPNTLSEFGL